MAKQKRIKQQAVAPTAPAAPPSTPPTPPLGVSVPAGLMTPSEIARFCHVTPRTIRRLVRAKRIPVVNVGASPRFEASEVLAALKSGG